MSFHFVLFVYILWTSWIWDGASIICCILIYCHNISLLWLILSPPSIFVIPVTDGVKYWNCLIGLLCSLLSSIDFFSIHLLQDVSGSGVSSLHECILPWVLSRIFSFVLILFFSDVGHDMHLTYFLWHIICFSFDLLTI